jgi:hypothetical protein
MPMAGASVEAVDAVAPSPSNAPASHQNVQAAIAKAVELRQLHAALLQRGAPNGRAGTGACRSPTVIRLPPVTSPARSKTGNEGYPVFTPVSGLPKVPCLGWLCAWLMLTVTDNFVFFFCSDRYTTRRSAWPR